MDVAEKMLTVAQAAAILQVSPREIYRWCSNGELQAKRVGRKWRIPSKAVYSTTPLSPAAFRG